MAICVKPLVGEIINISENAAFKEWFDKHHAYVSKLSRVGMSNKSANANIAVIMTLMGLNMTPKFFFYVENNKVIFVKELATLSGCKSQLAFEVFSSYPVDIEFIEVSKESAHTADILKFKENPLVSAIEAAGHDTVNDDYKYLNRIFTDVLPVPLSAAGKAFPLVLMDNKLSAKDAKDVRLSLYPLLAAISENNNVKVAKGFANVGKMHTKSLEGFGVSDEKVADLLVSILPFAQSPAKGEDGEIQIGATMPKLDVQLVYYYGILYLTNRKISWEVFPNVKTGKELTPFIKEWIAKQ